MEKNNKSIKIRANGSLFFKNALWNAINKLFDTVTGNIHEYQLWQILSLNIIY